MKLCDKIRIIRKARGKSQEELAFDIGLSRQAVSDWENGKYEPTLDNVRNLSIILYVSFDTLLDESIDLNDEYVLNDALMHIDKANRSINDFFRYHIHKYEITKIDYIRTIIYFPIVLIGIVLTIVGYSIMPIYEFGKYLGMAGVIVLFDCLGCIGLIVNQFKRFKNGGDCHSIGTLSKAYFVLIDWFDNKNDKTRYIPFSEIEKMELDKNANSKHGNVVVYIKNRNKPIVTDDIVRPDDLIKEFNNLNVD